jgi:hypothetical protein
MDVTATSTSYLFKQSRLNDRKGKIVRHYMGRSSKGRAKGLMNAEELASIWHFPLESVVKAPLIQKTPGRKAEPPISLPIGDEMIGEKLPDPLFQNISEEDLFESKQTASEITKKEPEKKKTASEEEQIPDNLPFL